MAIYEHPESGIRIRHRHAPRTSGTSITYAFQQNSWLVSEHELPHKHRISDTQVDHDFMVVRNPWHKLQSSFKYWNPEADITHNYFTKLQTWFQSDLCELTSEHLIPQHKFLGTDTQIWYFENIDNLHRDLHRKYGIPKVGIANNRGRTYDYLDNYDGTDKIFMEKYLDLYHADHEKFGYDLPRGMK